MSKKPTKYYLSETACFASRKETWVVTTSNDLRKLEKEKEKLEEEHRDRCIGDPDRPNLIYRIGKTRNLGEAN